ncbi:MAG: TonB-dependent receptor [Gammaproteobacteria bacterium]|nr:TonB-dependent receptor [Gammaproteobacteria bacterium]
MTRQIVSTMLLLFPLAVAAAEPGQTGRNDTAVIEEIVVTANFRDERLGLVPSSVSVVSADAIAKRGATHLEALFNMTPNVNYASGASRGRFFQIRGVGERSQFKDPLDPSVGLIVDGIDLSGIGLAGTLFDMAQVEILRGPQGTTFGSSAMGGLVLMRSQAPGDTFEGKVSSGVANYGRWHVGAALGGPLSDTVSARLSVHQFQGDGYIKNDFLGADDTNNFDELTLRGRLRWQPREDTTVDVGVLHVDADNGYDAFSLENTRITGSDEPGHDRQETTAFSAQATYAGFERFVVEASAFFEQSDLAYGFDWDWSYLDLVGWQGGEDNVRDRDSFGVDLRLISTGDGVGWVVGAYAYRRDVRLDYSDRCIPCGGASFFSSDFETQRFALYGEIDLALGERLRLSVGARVETYDDGYSDSAGVMADPDDTMWGVAANLQYLISDTLLVYAAFDRGYKTGGVNGQAVAAADPAVDPVIAAFLDERLAFEAETLLSYELGLKGSFLEDRMTINVSAFFMQRDDMQANSWVLFPPANWRSYIDNVDQGENWGLELELGWRPTDALQLKLGLGLLDTELGELIVQDVDTGDALVQEGRSQAHAPDYQLYLSAEYRFGQNYFVGAEFEAKDSFYFSNSHDIASGAQELVHASLGYRGQSFDVTLWGRNLLDRDYAVRGFYFANNPLNGWITESYRQLGEPRTYGVTAQYHF